MQGRKSELEGDLKGTLLVVGAEGESTGWHARVRSVQCSMFSWPVECLENSAWPAPSL